MGFRFGYRTNKYKAKPTEGFGSKFEAAVYYILLTREKLGEIKEIKKQQTVVLQGGDRSTRITWRVDFSFTEVSSGNTVYCEAKGFETNDYKLKLKMWRGNPPFKLIIYKGSYQKPKLVETIELKNG